MTGLALDIEVSPGPRLLDGIADGPGLGSHRARFGPLPSRTREELEDLAETARLRGRGGAGFPFAKKLAAIARVRRPVLVVNWSEGEPASHKDAALGLRRPHLVLDGVALVAQAWRTREVHVILSGENQLLRDAVTAAIASRTEKINWRVHHADDRFVAGQARAVLELMSGRENLPVTAWAPEAYDGHKGRPTLLSNAETWAQLAALVLDPRGIETTLLTLDGETWSPRVVEVTDGTLWSEVLGEDPGPVLIGGYHGVWVRPERLEGVTVSRDAMVELGVPLGAGAVITLAADECPVKATARIAGYLADQSAQRCGPCFNGLPALATALRQVAAGHGADGATERVRALCGLVERRGACAHPDGTARMVRSLFTEFPDEVARHDAGTCTATTPDRARELSA